MKLLFSMSLAGSMVFLVYLVIRPLTVRYFTSVWRCRFLKAALIVYLLPYQYFKYYYYDIFYDIFFHTQYRSSMFGGDIVFYDMDRLILVDEAGKRSIKYGNILAVLLAAWGIVVVLFAIYQIWKYISCKKELRQISKIPDSNLCEILDQCREQTGIQKKVGLFYCPRISTPFTIGIFSPRIILPETMKEKESVWMAVSHELIHVKNHDIFIKFTALLVMILHWYNPLTYLLYREICRVCEYVCDEAVTQNMTREEKETYQLLIVEMAQESSRSNTIFVNAFSNQYKTIKERIILMDRLIIPPKHMHIISLALAVLLLVMSPLPVMAYSPMVENKWNIMDKDYSFDGEIYYLSSEQDAYYLFDFYDPFLKSDIVYDIFIDDNGNPSIIYEPINQDERSICNHIWNNGKIYSHIKNKDGGCTVDIYNGQQCSKCGVCITENLFTSMQFPQCPH